MKITDEAVEAAKRIRDTAMEQTMAARIPEIGHFGAIAQDADWLVDHLTACQQEVERLQGMMSGTNKVITGMSRNFTAAHEAYEARIRILELEADLEIERGKLRRAEQ